jgi:predicted DNA-binding transcriptional regulator YafY
MPKNKSYDDRKKILNEAFRSPRSYTIEELIQRVSDKLGMSVSKKTIQNDIRAMKLEAMERGGELVCINSRYTYQPKNINLFEVKVDPASIDKIKLAASILKQIPGLDIHEELQEVFTKLEMRASDIEDEPEIIQFDTRPDYTGAKHLAEILEAIKGETVIAFDYQPFVHSQPMHIVLHPYLLKEYNNRWFVVGLPEHLRLKQQYDFHVYGLERIKGKIKPATKTEYYRHYTFNAATYYKNVIGVTIPKGTKPETIKLRFKIPRAFYVQTNPLHPSQKLIETTDTHLTFSYQLVRNPELEALILSFGKDLVELKGK